MTLAASSPCMMGMRMSISTTWGLSAFAWRTAWTPSLASPTTRRSAAESTSILNPARTRASSSAISTRIASAGLLGWPGLSLTGGGPQLAAGPRRRTRPRRPRSAVGHGNGELRRAMSYLKPGACRGSVLRHVGQRLLGDAVGGELLGHDVGTRLPGALVTKVEAALAQSANEPGKIAEDQRGGLVPCRRVPDLPEEVPQFVKRGTTGSLNGGERGSCFPGLLVQQQPRHTRPDRDHAQTVRHHVVHVPGQPEAFFSSRAPLLLRSPAMSLKLQAPPVDPAGTHDVARQPRRDRRNGLNGVLVLAGMKMNAKREHSPGGQARQERRCQR